MTVVVTGIGAALPDATDPAGRLGRKGLRYKDRASLLALCAVKDALANAGLLPDRDPAELADPAVPAESIGVVVSSNLGNLDTVCRAVDTIASRTVTGTSPMDLPNASSNEVAAAIAIWFQLRGANLTICNGPTSGLDAIWWAAVLVGSARVDRVVVVGVEVDNEPVRRLVDPAGSAQLFDGAVALVVEAVDAAASRMVPALAAVGDYARCADLAESVQRVAADRSIGLWMVPDEHTAAPPGLAERSVIRRDLSGTHGRSSGALGVLQCAAGTEWLRSGEPGAVLATAGGDTDDAVAALLLTSIGGDR